MTEIKFLTLVKFTTLYIIIHLEVVHKSVENSITHWKFPLYSNLVQSEAFTNLLLFLDRFEYRVALYSKLEIVSLSEYFLYASVDCYLTPAPQESP